MNIATTYSAQLTGLTAELVTIEVDISNGLHSFSVVGLGDRSVDESKDRISAAIKNSGYVSPKQKNQKVVISLAPADIRKEGPSFDVAMALAYLTAAHDIEIDRADMTLFLGELSLDGSIRRVSGVLPILCQASKLGVASAFIPRDNSAEAVLAQGLTVYPAASLRDIVRHLSGEHRITPLRADHPAPSTRPSEHCEHDMRFIRGNESAKRALEIAAAGAHNVIMKGPPGTGKTMLAQSFRTILPPLDYEHAIEVTSIYSAARKNVHGLISQPPFRTPHHTSSYPAVIGGGSIPRPGEVTLAHRGILFLDELPEFDRDVLEALRQPLEERSVTIARARGTVTFPAQCILVASMNPCPCGRGKSDGCVCTERALRLYKNKLSGPVSDRIDIWIPVTKIDYERLAEKDSLAEDSLSIRTRVEAARSVQASRFARAGLSIRYNSEMQAGDIGSCVDLSDEARSALKRAAEKMSLSGRGFHRVIKVAQTIADLSGQKTVNIECVLEALQYREKI